MSSCLGLYIREEFPPKVLPSPLPRPFYISQVRPGSSAYPCPGKGEERLHDELKPVILYFLELETLTLCWTKLRFFLQGKGGVRWLWVSNQQCLWYLKALAGKRWDIGSRALAGHHYSRHAWERKSIFHLLHCLNWVKILVKPDIRLWRS